MRKKFFSIIIVSESGARLRNYTFSQLTTRILLGILVCLIGGAIWMFFQYGSILEKSLEIKALKHENQEMYQKYLKLQQFESEFGELKNRTIKIANALGIKQPFTLQSTKVSFSPKDSLPVVASTEGATNTNVTDTSISENSEKKSDLLSLHPVKGWVTRKFSSSHPAVDIAAEYGDPVVSTMDGYVEFAGEHSSLGKVIEIVDKSSGFKIIYGHLSRITVVEGTNVRQRDLRGFVGSTGESSGPHLHYEIRLNGIPQDPEKYLAE